MKDTDHPQCSPHAQHSNTKSLLWQLLPAKVGLLAATCYCMHPGPCEELGLHLLTC